MKKLWIVLAAMLILLSNQVFAQDPSHEQHGGQMMCMPQMGGGGGMGQGMGQGMGMGGGMDCPMCDGMNGGSIRKRGNINYLLNNRDTIGLNANQVNQLRQMRNDMVRRGSEIQSRLRVARFELMDLMDAEEVNIGAVEKKIREISNLEADMKVLQVRSHIESMNVLTPEQREQVMSTMNPGMKRMPMQQPQQQPQQQQKQPPQQQQRR